MTSTRSNQPRLRTRFGSARRGFSLLELTIVVGLIVLLAALVLGVGTGLLVQSENRETSNALLLLDSAVGEWESATGRTFTYGLNGQPAPGPGQPLPKYDFQETLADNNTIVELLKPDFLGGAESAKTILAKIDPSLLRTRPNTTPPLTELLDAWGNPVVVVFPGRAFVSSDNAMDRDLDGTLRTAQEKRLGVCRNKKLLLVSAGRDGVLGDLKGSQAAKDAGGDNVYSYEPLKP